MSQLPLCFSAEVADAISDGQPIVALESTVITHGLPRPLNLEVAQALEQDVRAEGAVPATICLQGGQIKVGLTADELFALAEAEDVVKASTRDLAYVLATENTASTTVAATMHCARLAGISMFATGGIGGVHRGASDTFDISADLLELARTPVNVVCAGCKSILDLEKTLEFLETQAVPVIGYGQQQLPAFYSRESHLQLTMRVDSPKEAAEVITQQRALQLTSGILITNPVPKAQALAFTEVEQLIEHALDLARQQRITGKATTPFLLQTLAELGGRQITDANIALIRNNATVAAKIARALCGA